MRWLVILQPPQWRQSPRAMVFGKDVVLPYAAVVSWMHASETSELTISCKLLM
uniref:At3g22240 n=1 Tax=Arabidopsis thaliana TaxID=3702 RepID=A2RVS7_ARATH|nr:At3g22240 [Arabidopsis thaliana]